MLPYGNSRITRVALGIFFIVVVAYGYFEARGLLFGPRIDIPTSASVSHEQFVRVQGKTDHIASLSMNGKSISVTENGAFDEPFLLAPGSNRIVLTANDKYGNTATKMLDIFYVPSASSSLTTPAPFASSTRQVSTTSAR